MQCLTLFSCTRTLLLQVSNMENSNTRAELERIKSMVLQHLQELPPVPSVAVAVMPPATKVSQQAAHRQYHRQVSLGILTCADAGML